MFDAAVGLETLADACGAISAAIDPDPGYVLSAVWKAFPQLT
jgi:hypothetical protein